jgi:hypothetical protein
MREMVERALALSRGSLERDFRAALRLLARKAGEAPTGKTVPSRGGLGAQLLDSMGDSVEKLVPLSHMCLGKRAPP